MSVYSVKGKGWRYDFTLAGSRYTEAWFKTKAKAKKAEAEKRKELEKQTTMPPSEEEQTDTGFLEMVNLRLDHVKLYKSQSYYQTYRCLARGWTARWGKLECNQVTRRMVELMVMERSRVSALTANKEIRYLKATFNWAVKQSLATQNPVDGIEFLPIEKRLKYIPPIGDIDKVLAPASPEIRDYLLTICDTMARVGEINRLTWDDVNLEERYVILYTRKKRGGHLTPRKVPMTQRLHELLMRRFSERKGNAPWVFVNRYKDPKTGQISVGPYKYRATILKTLCKKVGVRHFRFHALRHAGASILDNRNVPIGYIQKILGHENRTTTEIYLHSMDENLRDAMTVFEQVCQKSHTDSHTEQKKGLRSFNDYGVTP